MGNAFANPEERREYIRVCVYALGCLALAALSVALPILWFDAAGCKGRWPERATSWGLISGCLVKTESGGWVPGRSLIIMERAK